MISVQGSQSLSQSASLQAPSAAPDVSKIRIRLKAFDYHVLDSAAQDICSTARRTGALVKGPIPLPTRIEKFTVLRGPHIDKRSREQFEMRTHKRLLDIVDPTPATVDALMKLDLNAGVDVEIKLGENKKNKNTSNANTINRGKAATMLSDFSALLQEPSRTNSEEVECLKNISAALLNLSGNWQEISAKSDLRDSFTQVLASCYQHVLTRRGHSAKMAAYIIIWLLDDSFRGNKDLLKNLSNEVDPEDSRVLGRMNDLLLANGDLKYTSVSGVVVKTLNGSQLDIRFSASVPGAAKHNCVGYFPPNFSLPEKVYGKSPCLSLEVYAPIDDTIQLLEFHSESVICDAHFVCEANADKYISITFIVNNIPFGEQRLSIASLLARLDMLDAFPETSSTLSTEV